MDTREEFDHQETDSVIGRKVEGESQVMTMVKRIHRKSIWLKAKDYSAEMIDETLANLIEHFVDNGLEFANIFQVVVKGIAVKFTHPYSSCGKCTNKWRTVEYCEDLSQKERV